MESFIQVAIMLVGYCLIALAITKVCSWFLLLVPAMQKLLGNKQRSKNDAALTCAPASFSVLVGILIYVFAGIFSYNACAAFASAFYFSRNSFLSAVLLLVLPMFLMLVAGVRGRVFRFAESVPIKISLMVSFAVGWIFGIGVHPISDQPIWKIAVFVVILCIAAIGLPIASAHFRKRSFRKAGIDAKSIHALGERERDVLVEGGFARRRQLQSASQSVAPFCVLTLISLVVSLALTNVFGLYVHSGPRGLVVGRDLTDGSTYSVMHLPLMAKLAIGETGAAKTVFFDYPFSTTNHSADLLVYVNEGWWMDKCTLKIDGDTAMLTHINDAGEGNPIDYYNLDSGSLWMSRQSDPMKKGYYTITNFDESGSIESVQRFGPEGIMSEE